MMAHFVRAPELSEQVLQPQTKQTKTAWRASSLPVSGVHSQSWVNCVVGTDLLFGVGTTEWGGCLWYMWHKQITEVVMVQISKLAPAVPVGGSDRMQRCKPTTALLYWWAALASTLLLVSWSMVSGCKNQPKETLKGSERNANRLSPRVAETPVV